MNDKKRKKEQLCRKGFQIKLQAKYETLRESGEKKKKKKESGEAVKQVKENHQLWQNLTVFIKPMDNSRVSIALLRSFIFS